MIIQNFILPSNMIRDVESLYVRSGSFEGDFPLCMNEGKELDLRSYFNFLSLEKWNKYTRCTKFSIYLNIKGSFKISLYHYKVFNEKLLMSIEIFESSKIEIPNCPMDGLLGIAITSSSNDSVLYGGGFSSDESPNDVRIGVDICTFHREDLVTDKVRRLSSYFSEVDVLFSRAVELFVIDNGDTFKDITCNENLVHVIKCDNLGGSGGFTRGMIEILDDSSFTHILLNDDDAIFDPETLYRTWSFISMLKTEYQDIWIGSPMLLNDRPTTVHESGAKYQKRDLIPNKNGLDLSSIQQCLDIDKEEPIDYLGWWYCAFPCSVISKIGYPLPLFVKEDDVEYGIRYNGVKIVLSSIAIWHDSFKNRFSPASYYYYARNHLIIGCTTGDISKKDAIWMLRNALLESVCYRYECSDMMYKGMMDFIKGPEYVFPLCLEGPNESKDTNVSKIDSIVKNNGLVLIDYVKNRNHLLRAITLNGSILPSDKVIRANTYDMHSSNFYRLKAVIYDLDGDSGFIAKRNLKKTISACLTYMKINLILRLKFKGLKRKYMDSKERYISKENWEAMFRR